MTSWQDWVGRTQLQCDSLTPSLVQRHRATLDLEPSNPAPLPGIHWVLNLPEAATADLGEDGHPRRDIAGSFLPPVDLPRRMWASSEVEFLAPIHVGATVTRSSTISDIVEKNGSSGRLAFVTLTHQSAADGVAAISEKQTLVYRAANSAAAAFLAPRTRSAVVDESHWPNQRILTPTEALLFRYSALTFNSHRIHYDAPYACDVEGYPGLVVHGPLTATLLLNWAGELFGAIRRFSFHAVSPAFAGEVLTLVARQESDSIILAALGPTGEECIKASAVV